MSSQQAIREDKDMSSKKEEPNVSKMAQHYETLADNTKESDMGGEDPSYAESTGPKKEEPNVSKMAHHFETLADNTKELDMGGEDPSYAESTGPNKEEPNGSKMGHHFETLADEAKESDMGGEDSSYAEQATGPKSTSTDTEIRTAVPYAKTPVQVPKPTDTDTVGSQETRDSSREAGKETERHEGVQEEKESHSLEDIGKYRQQAQQNSMEAIRGAEERYAKAKESEAGAGAGAKQSGEEKRHSKEMMNESKESKDSEAKESGAGAKQSGEAKESGQGKLQEVKDTTTPETEQEGSYKDTSENARQGLRTATDTDVNASNTAMAEQAKEVAAPKAAGLTGAAVTAAGTAAQYVGGMAVGAKDAALKVGKSAASTGAGVGKTAAGYAGQTAVQVKDAAVETGWRVAHFSLERAAELAEVTATMEHRVAELAAQKAEEAKETKRKEQEGMKEGDEKWHDVSTDFEGSMGSKSKPTEQTTGGKDQRKNSQEGLLEAVGETATELAQSTEQKLNLGNKGPTEDLHGEQVRVNKDDQVGILGAVGETLVEIAQSTKDLVIGQEPKQN